MISILPGRVRPIGSLVSAGLLAASFTCHLWAQTDADRPHIDQPSQPIAQSSLLNDGATPTSTALLSAGSEVEIEGGLTLPSKGHVWAVDTFQGKAQLVQMKYLPTNLDNHAGSNVLKTNLAPFMYKPKATVEISGAAAGVRLHETSPAIYIRGYGSLNVDSDDAADPAASSNTQTQLIVVRLETKKDKRIISTIAFTQITGHAARNNQSVQVNIKRVGKTDWQKITPVQPLEPGEYALVPMPRGQNLFPSSVFDFAIDPKAPANPSDAEDLDNSSANN